MFADQAAVILENAHLLALERRRSIQLEAALRAQVRSSDVLARYGGEEFVILLLATTKEQAALMAERLRGVASSPAAGRPQGGYRTRRPAM